MQCVSQELKAESTGDGGASLLLDSESLERVLWARLSFIPAGYPQTPLAYLMGCYTRATSELRPRSAASPGGRNAEAQQALTDALVYAKQLIVSYTGLMLNMDMFPQ
eukprot:scaffold648216_cov53-Prasinocladus_malaysianus.AAC.1